MTNHSDIDTTPKLSARLHWYHWLVVVGSLLLTFGAWYIASQQAKKNMQKRFDFQAEHIVQLVQERMGRYEEALWAGVAALHVIPDKASRQDWYTFSRNLKIEKRFPGINGIGVIHMQTPESLPAYLAWQRQLLPDYAIHPVHDKNEYWPITYIEPEQDNAKAVGLDMAHEHNRYTAAKKSRNTGSAQITGPIVLVQDAQKTPGFLFFVPWYIVDDLPASQKGRQETFRGLVYAPFIIFKLMHGVLANSNRQVNFSLYDGESELYSELTNESVNYDANPLFKRNIHLDLYGRSWRFHIQSSSLFREQHTHYQPLMILVGGIIIDTLLLILFVVLARANNRAVLYADEVTRHLQHRQVELATQNARLEDANSELNQFAYIASHDLKEPLRTLRTFSNYLLKDLEAEKWDRVTEDVHHVDSAAKRMTSLITALLELSRAGNADLLLSPIFSGQLIEDIKNNLKAQLEDSGAEVTVEDSGLVFSADKSLLTQVLQNLVSNAVKFHKSDHIPTVAIRIIPADTPTYGLIEIQDEGIGIEPSQLDTIFLAFKRLHGISEYEGTGIGLAIVKKIVERHGGTITVNSTLGDGSCFSLCLPLDKNSENTHDQPTDVCS